ncbi:class I SAM-dependent methyltransferase [Streptomyces sp. NPDC059788]|uniref:class I SAM-dependent methyltransferase n=1 Tax=Streptomyces sp. NPDC059788 TaxID=3346948 RepID=UPI003660D66F
MSSQFDALGRMYEEMAELPWRRDLESYTVLEVLGGQAGRSVLDIGCGTGQYCRALRRAGAGRVVGYDISAGMIAHAAEREAGEPLGIQYTTEPPSDGDFDVALGVYVLPYATTYPELVDLCSVAARALAPGGLFVTLPVNPDYAGDPAYYEPYGLRLHEDEPRADASRITLELCFGPYEATISARYWSRCALQSALVDAGFTDVAWHAFRVSPDGLRAHGPAFWSAYLRCPHASLITCRLGR